MKIFAKPKYLYLCTEDQISYHLGEDGKIYVYKATQEINRKRIACSSIIAVVLITFLRGLTGDLSIEYLRSNSLLIVFLSILVGVIAGTICLLFLKDDTEKTFSKDKTIEMDEVKIKELLNKGFQRRVTLKLFIYGWVLLSFVVSVLMIFGYMLNMVWISPVMWTASVLLLYTGKFFATQKKATIIIKNR